MVSYDLCNSPWNDKKKSPCTHNCVPCEKFCSFYTALKHSVNFFQPVKTSFLTFNIYYTTINGDKQEELLTVMYYSITKYLLESSSLTKLSRELLGTCSVWFDNKSKTEKKKSYASFFLDKHLQISCSQFSGGVVGISCYSLQWGWLCWLKGESLWQSYG